MFSLFGSLKFIPITSEYLKTNIIPPLTKEKLYLFDIDDTLYKSTPDFYKAELQSWMEVYNSLIVNYKEPIGFMDLIRSSPMQGAGLYQFFHKTAKEAEVLRGDFPFNEYLTEDIDLKNFILNLPHRKFCFTNGTKSRASNILISLGLQDCFEGVICIDDNEMGTRGKPFDFAFSFVESLFNIKDKDKDNIYFFDDSTANIEGAKKFGWRTFKIDFCFSYIVSKFDPELQQGQKDILGFLKEHNKTVDIKDFGDLSIVTYNMEKKEALDAENQTNELIKLIDNAHPPLIFLQEVEKSQLKELKSRILPHYGIAEGEESMVINPTNSNETFIPILYDTEEFRFVKSGKFMTNDPIIKNTYATWAVLNFKKKNLDIVVININLYSTKSLVDSLELASILYDIESTPYIKNKIIFISGTINGMSENTNTLLKKSFIKLSNYNKSDGDLINTLNTYMDVLNNTERDFILALNTGAVKAQPVYSSVLRLFKYGARFPVHSIITLNI